MHVTRVYLLVACEMPCRVTQDGTLMQYFS